MLMPKKTQVQLSPIERGARNCIAAYLFQAGFSVGSIAKILSVHESTISRTVESKDWSIKLMDIITAGK